MPKSLAELEREWAAEDSVTDTVHVLPDDLYVTLPDLITTIHGRDLESRFVSGSFVFTSHVFGV